MRYSTVNSYVPMNIFLSHAKKKWFAYSYANSCYSHTNIFLSGVRKKEYFHMRKEYFRMICNSDREAQTPTTRSV